ncbi:MAG: host-nuclease inhibitor Gam family protein [Bacteroidota bacterium]|nr:host-nuclease inhibitor Gam family protein [Bacteroidota bacterium]
MERQTPTWLQDLLDESEVQEKQQLIEFNKIKADQALAAIAIIEEQINEINSIAEQEIKLVQEWNLSQLEKLNKKISWLSFNLEMFIKKLDEPTVTLAHGIIKIRKGRDKVEVIDEAKFLIIGQRLGLVRTISAKIEPDLQAISNYIKINGGKPPSGVMLTPGQPKFSFKTITKGDTDELNERNDQQTKVRTNGVKSASQTQAA